MSKKITSPLPVYEQETHVSWMRDENTARIYTSDSTQITRFDNLCEKSPVFYRLIEETAHGKIYECRDKTMVSFRSRKKTVTEEQRLASGIRMKEYHDRKRAGSSSASAN